MIMPLSLTLLSAAVPPARRAMALGTWGAIAETPGQGGEPVDAELPGVVHALRAGFVTCRLTSPEALSADVFGRAAGWLPDGQKMGETRGRQR